MTDAWNEKAVFLAALELSGQGRADYLDGACPSPAHRARIEALLARHAQVRDRIDTPAADADNKASERRQSDDDQANGVAGAGEELGASPASPSSLEATGVEPDGWRIGEFEVIREIGRGGMGIVYLARDTTLGRLVALKLVSERPMDDPVVVERLRREARATAAISHPAIVPLFKFDRLPGKGGGQAYLVNEFVDGPTLKALIGQETARRRDRGGDPAAWRRQVAGIVADIAEALEACHRAGFLHRDVKPSNILVDPQRGGRLTDFGVATRLAEPTSLAEGSESASPSGASAGGAMGTVHYMSPELVAAEQRPIDQRSDVFSLGVVLYEALALRRPFDGQSQAEVLAAVERATPSHVRTIDRRTPLDLATIVHKALEREPEARYQSAQHMAADLRSWLAGLPILATPPTLAHRARRALLRHRRAATIVVGLLLLATVVALGLAHRQGRDARDAFVVFEAAAGTRVLVQLVDPDTKMPESTARDIGRAPRGPLRLAPGAHRISFVDADRQLMAEVDVRLAPGREATQTIVLIPHDEPWPAAPAPATLRVRAVPELGVVDGSVIELEAGPRTVGMVRDLGIGMTARTVELPPFVVDRHLVSNRDYAAFVAETGHAPPPVWRGGAPAEALLDRPVVGVTRDDAEAYARWRGKRLPTTWEWDAAVRGADGSADPWREVPPDEVARLKRMADVAVESLLSQCRSSDFHEMVDLYELHTLDVTRDDPFVDLTRRIVHAFGNVREITSTVHRGTGGVVVRGRAWSDPAATTLLDQIWLSPHGAATDHGFRCARTRVAPPTVP